MLKFENLLGGKMADFKEALKYVLLNEGGYVNDPFDHGHATNFGITHDQYAHFRGVTVTDDDIKNLTLTEVQSFYRNMFWLVMGLDNVMDTNVAAAILDFAVVRGPTTATKTVQKLCGQKEDGHFGTLTATAVNGIKPNIFISSLSKALGEQFLYIATNDNSQMRFLKGWLNRANKMLTLIV